MKIFFTWWNRQTFGTYLKTLFFGKYVGKDEFGNKYYKNKNDDRWVVYSKSVEATKITTEWYLWMHHTLKQYSRRKKRKKNIFGKKNTKRNQTGTNNRYKPVKIKKNEKQKKYETWK